jgi:hypothetical protein
MTCLPCPCPCYLSPRGANREKTDKADHGSVPFIFLVSADNYLISQVYFVLGMVYSLVLQFLFTWPGLKSLFKKIVRKIAFNQCNKMWYGVLFRAKIILPQVLAQTIKEFLKASGVKPSSPRPTYILC